MVSAFIRDIYRKRRLIWELAKRDYRQQNKGSVLGVLWNYLQPILFMTVLYLVFTLGFRSGVDADIPFSLYLISGMVCWLFFADSFSGNTHVIRSYSFLVKKMDFRLSILPLVKFISSSPPHFILTSLVVAISAWMGINPSLYLLQLIYYFTCMLVLLAGLGWLTSSTSVFVKDVGNIVGVFVQFGFWLTPIFWRIDMMPEKVQMILKLNPVYYLVTGYRDAIFSQRWFWERPQETAIFWLITAVIVLFGVVVFKRLKPHFAEVM